MKRTYLLLTLTGLLATACGAGDDVAGTAPAVSAPVTTTATPSTGHYDPTRLAVGDNMFATSPTVGKIYTCRTTFDGGGASAQGPWFNGDGTWNSLTKVAVKGSVSWDSASVKFNLSGTSRVITANALPMHTTGAFPISPSDPAYEYDRNPNSISAQTISATLPANPTAAASPGCIGGEVGIALDGVPIFDGFDAGGRDAVAWEVQDSCHGHPQRTGVYHYHDISPCLDDAGTGHSKLVGYAYDGFGIFGPRGEDGQPVSNDDLDACHGHTHEIDWDGRRVSMYHYHATAEFPYTIGCFHGTSAQRGPIGG